MEGVPMRSSGTVASLCFVLLGLSVGVSFAQVTAPPATQAATRFYDWAQTPPMGWNSWDSFGAGVWQADVLANP